MPKIPDEIGKYKILSCLGSGGTSIVYTATHPTLKRKVVLKKLNLRGNRQYYEGFRQEAALMMDLNHDNIVRVFDHFKEGSRHYIVMEFVEGCSLDEILKKGGPLPPGTSRYILECCCRALLYIHSRNIIHRDIKPSNIFISHKGEVKLGDFGIAGQENDNGKSGEFTPVGTPSYMAPEQFLPHARISGRTDIYALGVTLYEMLTGEKLYDGASLEELKVKILKSRHISLFRTLHSRGAALYWIVKRSSFRRPAFRFKSVRPVLRLLKLVAHSVRSSDARAVLTVLVDSVTGVDKKPGGRGPKPRHEPAGKVQPKRRRVWPVFLFLLLITGAGTFISLQTGSFYRLFFQGSKGAVQIRIPSGNESFVHTGYLHVYRDRSHFLEPVKSFDLSETGGYSDLFYLDTGNYRALVRWGSQVQWILFYLPPQDKQEEPRVIEIRNPDIPGKPLNIQMDITDALDGRDLFRRAVLSVQKGENSWVPVKELQLMTGEAYRFRLDCEGYYPRYLNVPLQFYQDSLDLEIQMIPLPGKLILRHEPGALKMRVNGKDRLPGGDEERSLLSFGRIPEGEREWLLSPGTYELSWESGGTVAKETLVIESAKVYSYTIQHMDDTLTISPY